MRSRFLSALVASGLVWLCASPAGAQPSSEEEEVFDDLVHSDLPLFSGGEDAWPQGFSDGDSFGCVSRVAFGDWTLRRIDNPDDAGWYRIGNSGVFHCWAVVSSAYERAELEGAEGRPSFFVLLGTAEVAHERVELWVLQIGARPGSDYLLLSRPPGDGPVEAFRVLQTQCPLGHIRDRGAMDILRTDYCAINSRSQMLAFARRMAHRPPLGTLVRTVELSAPSD